MTSRLFLVSLFLLVVYGGVLLVHDRGMPTEPAPLKMKPEDLPMTLGNWKGEAVTLDPEVFRFTGANMAMNRVYRDRGGRTISLHIAVFDKLLYGPQGPPHLPEVCYGGSGWTIGESESVSLEPAGATGNDSARQLPIERHGEKAYVLYWYQIEGQVYCTGDRQRQIVQSWRGRATRPPIVKVMMQTTAASAEDAKKTFLSLATEVFAWARSFH